jgi:hypothetical protein
MKIKRAYKMGDSTSGELWSFTTEVFQGICGDANDDGIINVSDAVYIINYVLIPGSPVPTPACSADVNGDGMINVSDAVYLINYLFIPGNLPPVEHCCDSIKGT